MSQLHTGTCFSSLPPENTDHNACYPEKTTTYILHVVPITNHTHVRLKSLGKKKGKERKGKGREGKERKEKKRKDKTRQDKTRQDKTRQDKTRQEKTRQDKTRQDKTRQDKKADPRN